MDIARIKALSVLGYNFGLHLMKAALPGERPDQAELFRSYFRDDRIAPFTAEEHEDLPRFEGCVGCGLCPAHCRVMDLAAGRFQGPMHIAASASRSQPDFIHDVDSIVLCAACGQCEPICPEAVPVSEIAAAMRRMIWRTAPETLPVAYHTAKDNLARHGNIYGPTPELEVPCNDRAEAVVVFGSALSRQPERARHLFELLSSLGYNLGLAEDGELGGVAAALGLAPDEEWVDALAASGAKMIIAADPDLGLALGNDVRLKDKTIKSALEAVMDKRPEGKGLVEEIASPAAFHDGDASGRRSGLGKMARELLGRAGVSLVEMDRPGQAAPPVGWEGGLDLVDPDLAGRLAAARLADARAAGAKTVITVSARDAQLLEAVDTHDGIEVKYLFELL